MHGKGRFWGNTCRFGTVPNIIRVISPYALHLQALTPTLGDVANPGQGLVPTFLDDLHVTDLEGKKSGQELGM